LETNFESNLRPRQIRTRQHPPFTFHFCSLSWNFDCSAEFDASHLSRNLPLSPQHIIFTARILLKPSLLHTAENSSIHRYLRIRVVTLTSRARHTVTPSDTTGVFRNIQRESLSQRVSVATLILRKVLCIWTVEPTLYYRKRGGRLLRQQTSIVRS
jgi:hypothetical protein